MLNCGCPTVATNGPEISDGRPDHGEAGSKGEDSRQKKPAAFRNFYVGRRPDMR